MPLREVVIQITARTEKAAQEFDKATLAMSRAAFRLEAIGRQVGFMAVLPMVGLVAGWTRALAQFEEGLSLVAKTTDMSGEALQEFGDRILDMSLRLPQAANELARLASIGAQLGIAQRHLLDFAETVAALDVATDINAEEAALQIAQLGHMTQTSQAALGSLASTLVALGNTTATTESRIMDMALRIATAGTMVGLTQAEIMALAASASELGIRSERGGTNISKMFIQVANAVAQGSKELLIFAQVAGMAEAEFAELFQRDPLQAVRRFIAGLQELGAQQAFRVLEQVGLANERAREVILALGLAIDRMGENVQTANEAWQSGNAHIREAQKFYSNLNQELKVVRNRLTSFSIVMGRTVLPAVRDMLGLLVNTTAGFGRAVDAAGGLSPVLARLAVDALGFVAALILVGTIGGSVAFRLTALFKGVAAVAKGVGLGVAATWASVLGVLLAISTALFFVGKRFLDSRRPVVTLAEATKKLGQSMEASISAIRSPEEGERLLKLWKAQRDVIRENVESLQLKPMRAAPMREVGDAVNWVKARLQAVREAQEQINAQQERSTELTREEREEIEKTREFLKDKLRIYDQEIKELERIVELQAQERRERMRTLEQMAAIRTGELTGILRGQGRVGEVSAKLVEQWVEARDRLSESVATVQVLRATMLAARSSGAAGLEVISGIADELERANMEAAKMGLQFPVLEVLARRAWDRVRAEQIPGLLAGGQQVLRQLLEVRGAAEDLVDPVMRAQEAERALREQAEQVAEQLRAALERLRLMQQAGLEGAQGFSEAKDEVKELTDRLGDLVTQLRQVRDLAQGFHVVPPVTLPGGETLRGMRLPVPRPFGLVTADVLSGLREDVERLRDVGMDLDEFLQTRLGRDLQGLFRSVGLSAQDMAVAFGFAQGEIDQTKINMVALASVAEQLGISSEELARRLGIATSAVRSQSEGMEEAVINAMGNAAQAITLGARQVATVLVNMIEMLARFAATRLLGLAGPGAALFGALVSTVGALFLRERTGPAPVRVEEFSQRAQDQQRQALEGPSVVNIRVVTPTGELIDELRYELFRRTRRDATVRIPAGAMLGR